MTTCATRDLSALRAEKITDALGLPSNAGQPSREDLRHILLGSPERIRQAIHQLHVLNYAETVIWSPISAVGDRLILTTTQGTAMSLLKRSR